MKETQVDAKCCGRKWKHAHASAANTVYGMGFVGALIYFLQHANGFSAVLMGILKALFWPGFLIYRLLEFLKF